NIGYGYHISRWNTLSILYGYQRVREHQEFTPTPDDDGNVPLPTVTDTRYNISTIAPAISHDTRDNPFDTTRGTRVGLTFGYSGRGLGGDVNIIKPDLTATWYTRLSKRTSFSLNSEIGTIFTQSNDCANFFADLATFRNILCVPRSERFYVGGENSIRGF